MTRGPSRPRSPRERAYWVLLVIGEEGDVVVVGTESGQAFLTVREAMGAVVDVSYDHPEWLCIVAEVRSSRFPADRPVEWLDGVAYSERRPRRRR